MAGGFHDARSPQKHDFDLKGLETVKVGRGKEGWRGWRGCTYSTVQYFPQYISQSMHYASMKNMPLNFSKIALGAKMSLKKPEKE